MAVGTGVLDYSPLTATGWTGRSNREEARIPSHLPHTITSGTDLLPGSALFTSSMTRGAMHLMRIGNFHFGSEYGIFEIYIDIVPQT
jgi:hypothetical protein